MFVTVLFKIYITFILGQWINKSHAMELQIYDFSLYTLLFVDIDDQVVITGDYDDATYMALTFEG